MPQESIKLNPFSSYLDTVNPRKCDFCSKHLIPNRDEVFVIERKNAKSRKRLVDKYLCMECGSKSEVVLFYNSNCTIMPYEIPNQVAIDGTEIPTIKFVEETVEKVAETPTEVPVQRKSFFEKVLNVFRL